MTIKEVAAMLRLGERSVYEMLRSGRIPGAAKAAGKWRVNREKLVAWMEAGGEVADAKEGGDKSDG